MAQNDKNMNPSPLDGQESTENEQQSQHLLFIGAKRALIGGLLAGGVAIAGQYMMGRIYSGTEARQLLEAVIPSARSLGTSVVTASSTILALMLTMISLSRHATSGLEVTFFKRIERIGLMSTAGLVAAMLLLLFLSIPIQESQQLPSSWYSIVYYILITFTAAVTGLLVAIVLMLYNAMQSLVNVVRSNSSQSPGKKSVD